ERFVNGTLRHRRNGKALAFPIVVGAVHVLHHEVPVRRAARGLGPTLDYEVRAAAELEDRDVGADHDLAHSQVTIKRRRGRQIGPRDGEMAGPHRGPGRVGSHGYLASSNDLPDKAWRGRPRLRAAAPQTRSV